MKNQSVFIISTAYSGSTLLGSILNSHTEIAYSGELSRYGDFYSRYRLDHEPAQCLECLLQDSECKVFDQRLFKKTVDGSILGFHRSLTGKLSKPIIVDGSKHVAWLRSAVSNKEPRQVKVIILSRNPIDYLTSCNDRGVEPLWAEANAWRDTYYDALRTCAELGLPHTVVHFEDFIGSRDKALQSICTLLGIKYSAQKFAHMQPLHAIGGNPAAYQASFDKAVFRKLASTRTQQSFDINPTRLKKLRISRAKKSLRVELAQTTFQTPGLVDVANILGYKKTDTF